MFISRLVAFDEDTHINYKIKKEMQKQVDNHIALC